MNVLGVVFKNVTRHFNVLEDIDQSQNILSPYNLEILREDMLQLEFDNGLLLDAGWLPEFDDEGFFIVRLINNLDWYSPVFIGNANDISTLKQVLNSIASKYNLS